MALDARSRSSIYQNLVPILGEHDANVLMSEFPSVEADELVTKQFLRAELGEFRVSIETAMDARFASLDARFASIDAAFAAMDTKFTTKEFVRAELGEVRVELAEMRSVMEAGLHRQTIWLGSGLAAATAFLAALGALT